MKHCWVPLAPYAVDPAKSLGRRFPETPHAYRDPFERDRGRVIHARAFRRLEDKTQVFTERKSDHFRNRLTHTIEVAQISRTIAAELALNADLTETLALVHDLGHPPFGHAGERVLDQLMGEYGEGFDHNLHALRTVEYLEYRYPQFRGLNLTFEVREGIIKHSRDWQAERHPQLREYLLGQRPPLEAQLIDLTDEIGYNTADLDDGVEAGILRVEDIRAGVPLFARLYEEAREEFPYVREKIYLLETLKRMLDYFAGDLIRSTAARVEAARPRTLEDLRKYPERLAGLSGAAEAERAQTKDFLYAALYYSPELKAHKQRGEQVIEELFRFWTATPGALPATYRQMAGLEPVTDAFMNVDPLHRVVCDYIAGMTDTFCLAQHARLIR